MWGLNKLVLLIDTNTPWAEVRAEAITNKGLIRLKGKGRIMMPRL